MSSSSFAKASAYTPPPDQIPQRMSATTSKPYAPHQPNFGSQNAQGPSSYGTSYQAGGIPSFGNAIAGDGYDAEVGGGVEGGTVNEWETRFGWRVDVVAAASYLLGPITALAFLILETHSDYIRFHSYQSALLTTPLILLRLLLSLLHFPQFFLSLLTFTIVLSVLFMAFRAYRDANSGGLSRYRLPWIGDLAERWVGEE
ncbi:hypothetical protein FRC03_001168 [Tulasnella sp. 419]|nr:hypothetical protein FRC02_000162 [Tulasnella sp. 418]KAG8964944.1 hypothetical protein FRC03_001168 [Tulasnella sp. 419]